MGGQLLSREHTANSIFPLPFYDHSNKERMMQKLEKETRIVQTTQGIGTTLAMMRCNMCENNRAKKKKIQFISYQLRIRGFHGVE